MPIEMPKGVPFSVDTWSCSSRRKRHHFLTHAHKDHSVGISPNFSSPIYSTHITKTLLLQQSPQLSSLLFVNIEVGQRLVIDDPDATFSVTAFDANHCPGAVMLLFEGEFGSILHTGDCRLTPDCLQCLPEKYIGKTGREPKLLLDYVFLDCTFGKSPIKIPSKLSAVQQVINCIWKHPDAPVVYLSCDLLGQEEILVEVSRIFGSKIYVNRTDNAEFYQALTVIAPDILSKDASLRFQVFTGFPKLYERAKAKMMEARANFEKEPLIIRPSTQWYACEESADIEMQRKLRFTEAQRDPFGVWHVCYSMHSSREELEWALQLLQPKRVVSTTPSCRAMELNYVKKQCFSRQIASDDPLWKLLDMNTEVESSSPEKKSLAEIPVNVVLSSSSHVEQHSTAIVEDRQLQPEVLSTTNVEHGLKFSPTIGRPPITLFGRARLGLQDSHFLLKEKENVPTKVDCPHISFKKNEKDKSVLKQDDGLVEVKFESSEEKTSEVVESVSNSNTGSPKMFSQSLRKMYRSMNVPVPQPLPSLVELFNSTKRARRFQF